FERSAIPMTGIPEEQAHEEVLEVDGAVFTMTAVSMGNPHAIIFMDEVRDEDVRTYGPKIEFHEWFPERTNVEFIQILNREEILFRVWERGSGVTLACGTGACAAAVAAALAGKVDRAVTVHLAGGDLFIDWREEDNRVYMTGPATEVFQGVYSGPIPYK
ncbi:diaminopimelate epimerase, partial [Mesorhizobium sp. M00.F.Ca.ET.186.01.1.1]